MEEDDRGQIERLLVRYCTLIDAKDIDALVDHIFAPDAEDNHGLGVWKGREGLHAGFTAVMDRFAGTVHQLANFVIDVDGDTATSVVYVTGWHWLPREGVEREPAGPAADFAVVGAYHDRIERRQEGWRIVHRTFRQVGFSVLGVGDLPDFMKPSRGVRA